MDKMNQTPATPPSETVCPNCKKTSEGKFCKYCGTAFEAAPVATPATPPATPTPPVPGAEGDRPLSTASPDEVGTAAKPITDAQIPPVGASPVGIPPAPPQQPVAPTKQSFPQPMSTPQPQPSAPPQQPQAQQPMGARPMPGAPMAPQAPQPPQAPKQKSGKSPVNLILHIVSAVLIVALAGFGIWQFSQARSNRDRVNSLQSQMVSKDTTITELQGQLDALESQGGDLDALQDKIDGMQEKVDFLDNNIVFFDAYYEYHLFDCPYRSPSLSYAADRAVIAEMEGYEPCSHCNP